MVELAQLTRSIRGGTAARGGAAPHHALHGVPQLQPQGRGDRRLAARRAGGIPRSVAAGRQADRAWPGAETARADFPRPPRARRRARPWRGDRGGDRRVALPDRALLARRRQVALDQRGNRLLQAAAPRGAHPCRDHRWRTVRQRDAGPRGGGMLPAGAAQSTSTAAADRPRSAPSRSPPTCGKRATAGGWACSRSLPE